MRLIKKYSNGRFFDTEAKKYIKTEEMADLVKKGEEMKITLTKTGRDVTKSVIAQFTKEESDQKKTSASKGKKAKAAAAKGKTKKKTDKKNGKREMPFLKTDKLVKWVGDLVDDKINKVLDIVKLPSREQVAQLDENIKALNKKIDELKLAADKKAEAGSVKKKSAQKAVQDTIEKALKEVAEEKAEEPAGVKEGKKDGPA